MLRIEDIQQRMCDRYCKYTDISYLAAVPESSREQYPCESCPLNDLREEDYDSKTLHTL